MSGENTGMAFISEVPEFSGSDLRVVGIEAWPTTVVLCGGCGRSMRENQASRVTAGDLVLATRCVDCLNDAMQEFCKR